jgi:hypothetical protein
VEERVGGDERETCSIQLDLTLSEFRERAREHIRSRYYARLRAGKINEDGRDRREVHSGWRGGRREI